MNKWKISLGMIAAAFTLSTGTAAAAENPIMLNFSDTGLRSSQIIAEGTTLVPLKPLAESMGYTLNWDQNAKLAKLIRPEREVTFKAGTASVTVNNQPSKLTKPPRMIKGSVYVPLVSAVQALGGKTWFDKKNGSLNIVDDPRFKTATLQNRTYWVSQKNGDLYVRTSPSAKPELAGALPLTGSPYDHNFSITAAGQGTDLLQLTDNHYSMFNNFSNGYQALVHKGSILKQMDYHYVTPAYDPKAQPASTQLFMTDGQNLQYINKEGTLGKSFDLEQLTGLTKPFVIEYAAPDVALVRSKSTTQLFAIEIGTENHVNLSQKLIRAADRPEWDRADGSDPYYLSRMLTLTARKANTLTFTYTPLPEEKPQTVTYIIGTK
ncbi:copper amine oxidase N-terminal domain-containing protein [Paenibacillus albidus]|uniref:copper amine oxidase N-terminal domain-containing protein n=1 Tax=Paenibacillus albidus TaxID=2041023 RepID=UPI001BE9602E|nr:copper amine oxidase N-terminal domain-containing protein [Paenibacillus albidus]MBT2293339.1 copper amine oxidase N-terminal domain-containing protein [Paenibacillus albidus]